jgi:hypothetical protein
MTTIESEPLEGEMVTEEPEPRELALRTPVTLFGTNDPDAALERMAAIAKTLVDVIDSRKLFATIYGRKHITAEGWTTLGGMLGIVPVVVWTRPNETGDGFVARVEARTLDGRIVGAAESECSRVESTWAKRDPYALRSMAQTRAIGRALRAPLGQIVVLAGYEPAGAEELPNRERDTAPSGAEHAQPEGPIPEPLKPTGEQTDEILALVRTLERIDADTDWKAWCRDEAGVPWRLLTRTGAALLIDRLRAQLADRAGGEEGDDA